jgi:hypothetical protein
VDFPVLPFVASELRRVLPFASDFRKHVIGDDSGHDAISENDSRAKLSSLQAA